MGLRHWTLAILVVVFLSTSSLILVANAAVYDGAPGAAAIDTGFPIDGFQRPHPPIQQEPKIIEVLATPATGFFGKIRSRLFDPIWNATIDFTSSVLAFSYVALTPRNEAAKMTPSGDWAPVVSEWKTYRHKDNLFTLRHPARMKVKREIYEPNVFTLTLGSHTDGVDIQVQNRSPIRGSVTPESMKSTGATREYKSYYGVVMGVRSTCGVNCTTYNFQDDDKFFNIDFTDVSAEDMGSIMDSLRIKPR